MNQKRKKRWMTFRGDVIPVRQVVGYIGYISIIQGTSHADCTKINQTGPKQSQLIQVIEF